MTESQNRQLSETVSALKEAEKKARLQIEQLVESVACELSVPKEAEGVTRLTKSLNIFTVNSGSVRKYNSFDARFYDIPAQKNAVIMRLQKSKSLEEFWKEFCRITDEKRVVLNGEVFPLYPTFLDVLIEIRNTIAQTYD